MNSLLPLRTSTESLTDRNLDPLLVDFDDAAADEILAAVTSSTARQILATLYDEPRTPSDLAEAVGTSTGTHRRSGQARLLRFPRGCTLTELAEVFDVNASAASGVLYRAEGRIIKAFVGSLSVAATSVES